MSNNSFTSIIEKHFRNNGGWPRIKGELAVFYWPRIAGPDLAAKVEALRYQEGYLYLQTENPALAHQLSMMNLDIIKKYQKVLGRGVIKSIKVKIGTITQTPPVFSSPKEDALLSSTEEKAIETCAQPISDSDVAARFKDLMKKVIQNQKKVLEDGGHRCLSCQAVIQGSYNYCPCCEYKINQEIKDYQNYLVKNNISFAANELPEGMKETNQTLIDKILKSR